MTAKIFQFIYINNIKITELGCEIINQTIKVIYKSLTNAILNNNMVKIYNLLVNIEVVH